MPSPPTSRLELNEPFKQGVKREIPEESGIEVRVSVYKNMTKSVIALIFLLCRPLNHQPRISEETTFALWMEPSDCDKYLDPAYAIRLVDAISSGSAVAIRAHKGVNLLVDER